MEDGTFHILNFFHSDTRGEKKRSEAKNQNYDSFPCVCDIAGFISATFKEENRNQMEIIGEGIYDVVGLVESLRNNVGHAELLSVEQVIEEIDKKIELKKDKESSSERAYETASSESCIIM